MPSERTINIDEPEDLLMAKILIDKKQKKVNDIKYCSKLDGGCSNEW